jgi:hypothetical protein
VPRFTTDQIRRRRIIVALAALLVAVGVGLWITLMFFFGGVTKQEFIDSADEICRSYRFEGSALGTTDLAETGELLSRAATELGKQTNEISELEAPDEDAGVLREWLDSQRDLEDTLSEAAEGAAAGSQDAFDQAMVGVNEVAARSTNLAVDYGFEVCGLSSE